MDVDDATTRITPGEVVRDSGGVDGPTTRIATAALLAFAPSPAMTTAPRPMVPSVPPVPAAVVSLAFGEYKLYFESSVRAVDRRLALNRWNYPAMSAVLLAAVAMAAWADDGDLRQAIVGGSGVLLLSLAAHLNCAFWLRQIEELHAVHDAKVRILNEMAPYVRYPRTARGEAPRSYEPARREREVMRGEDHDVAARSAAAEHRVAQVLRWTFPLVAAGAVALLVVGRL